VLLVKFHFFMEAVENLKQEANTHLTSTCHWHGALHSYTELDSVSFKSISTPRCLCNMSPYKYHVLSYYDLSQSSQHKMCIATILLLRILLKVNFNKDIHTSKYLPSCKDISLALTSNPNLTLSPYS
jgi:hypothetical protein